jgi:hypothetical protein
MFSSKPILNFLHAVLLLAILGVPVVEASHFHGSDQLQTECPVCDVKTSSMVAPAATALPQDPRAEIFVVRPLAGSPLRRTHVFKARAPPSIID